MHYYKFRSLENIKRFLDILINERLYAARYDKLNDPMEGSYLVDSHCCPLKAVDSNVGNSLMP